MIWHNVLLFISLNIMLVYGRAKGKIGGPGGIFKLMGTVTNTVKTLVPKSIPQPPPLPQQPIMNQNPQPQPQSYQNFVNQPSYQQQPSNIIQPNVAQNQPLYQQPMVDQQYSQMNPSNLPQTQQPSNRQYAQQPAFNPKEYYKEFYNNEYQDRLVKFIKRLTKIPDFLLSRKEKRFLGKMKDKLCIDNDPFLSHYDDDNDYSENDRCDCGHARSKRSG